jgi:hypothetical protein
MCSVESEEWPKRVVNKRLPGIVQRPLPVSAPQVGAFDSGSWQINVSRWVIPGSRLLATGRAANLQSGSPPVIRA